MRFPTREEGYLADQQPAVCKVEFAAEDLSGPVAERDGDGSWGGVLQILQRDELSEPRGGPLLQEARLKETLHFAEDSHALCVSVVTVNLWKNEKIENKSRSNTKRMCSIINRRNSYRLNLNDNYNWL